jgi:hypothetical protein
MEEGGNQHVSFSHPENAVESFSAPHWFVFHGAPARSKFLWSDRRHGD